jgi:hypothetical protein
MRFSGRLLHLLVLAVALPSCSGDRRMAPNLGTAMPDLGVVPAVARDMAAYLYTLH